MIYPKPYSIYLRGTIGLGFRVQGGFSKVRWDQIRNCDSVKRERHGSGENLRPALHCWRGRQLCPSETFPPRHRLSALHQTDFSVQASDTVAQFEQIG